MQYFFSDKIKTLKPSAIREMLKYTSDPSVISFAAGNPSAESFPVDEIKKIAADILDNRATEALQYSVTEGYTPLRQTMTEHLKKKSNIGRSFDDLIIVTGGQQGNDLTAKVLCNEGDVVIVENPSFIGSMNAFRAYNTKLVGIDLEDDGINLEQFEHALKTEKNIRLFYCIPSFQNPTGITTSLEKRKKIYQLCKEHGVIILEDNPYGDTRFSGEDIPTIKSFDEDGIVVYCSSFSKIVSPGVRVGYLCGPAEIISKVTVAKQCNDVHTNMFFQMLIDEYFKRYDIDSHIKDIRKIYEHKCSLMISEIDKHFDRRVTHTSPQGGLFLWCRLPQGYDSMKFASMTIANKVAIVPGSTFMVNSAQKSSDFRLNFSTPSDEQIVEGIDIVAKCLKDFLR